MNINLENLNENSAMAKQPNNIKVALKPHQLALLHAAHNLETNANIKYSDYCGKQCGFNTKIGFIGDVVGSGKTLSILGIIAQKIKLKKNNIETYSSVNHGFINVRKQELPTNYISSNIIVVPHTIVKQWENVLKNEIENINYIIINSSKNLNLVSSGFEKEYPDIDQNSIKSAYVKYFNKHFDIILISSTFYRKFYDKYISSILYNLCFSRVIYDEADTIKIAACSQIEASFYWFVSSTYENLLFPRGKRIYTNIHTGEYKYYLPYNANTHDYKLTQIDGLNHSGFIKNTMTGMFGYEPINNEFIPHILLKSSSNFIQASFSLEMPIDNYIVCEYPPGMNIVKDVISGEVLFMLNAGNVKGAIERINCQTVPDEKMLVKVITDDLENELHTLKLEYEYKSQINYSTEKAKKEALDKIDNKIANISSKISHIKKKLDENCPICYGEVENTCIAKCCNTAYCLECITMWLNSQTQYNQSCPFCRHKMSLNDIIVINSDVQDTKKKTSLKNKIFYLKQFLEKKITESHFKVLIFADYYESFEKIVDVLDKLSIKYGKIMGSSSTISKTIEKYKSHGDDSINVLMLNSNYCGSGLNLENTTDVVIYHYMNNERDKQIIGRAQRPGRKGKLNILRLCYENEVEYIKKTSKHIVDETNDEPFYENEGAPAPDNID